jgi:type IV secretion system protein VirD4
LFKFLDDETDPAADKKVIDRVSSVTRAYGIDRGMDEDGNGRLGF